MKQCADVTDADPEAEGAMPRAWEAGKLHHITSAKEKGRPEVHMPEHVPWNNGRGGRKPGRAVTTDLPREGRPTALVCPSGCCDGCSYGWLLNEVFVPHSSGAGIVDHGTEIHVW